MVEPTSPAESSFISLAELEWNLPLFDDIFLSMQGQNVMLVDFYLRDLERDLLHQLHETERTPLPATIVVSALSQMWIFAVYELLRTWRERLKKLKKDGQGPAVADDEGLAELTKLYRRNQLKQLRTDKTFGPELDRAYQKIETFYRRVEALRMNLAKHEVPKKRGVPALAPGYARMDTLTGSMQWQVDLGDKWVDLVSRQDLADQLRKLVIGGPTARQATR